MPSERVVIARSVSDEAIFREIASHHFVVLAMTGIIRVSIFYRQLRGKYPVNRDIDILV